MSPRIFRIPARDACRKTRHGLAWQGCCAADAVEELLAGELFHIGRNNSFDFD